MIGKLPAKVRHQINHVGEHQFNVQSDAEGNSDFGNFNITATTTSQQILTENKSRNSLQIQNNSIDTNIFLSFGTAATTAGLRIAPQAFYEPYKTPINTVNIITDGGTAMCAIVQGLNVRDSNANI